MLQKLKQLNIKKEYVMPLISLITVGVVMIMAMVAMAGSTLGWYASNDQVNANGMNISVKGMPDTEQYITYEGKRLDESATDIFADMRPGYTVDFQLHIKNKTDEKIDFQLLMAAPSAEQDTPYILDGLYHYFGSQLRLNSIKNGENSLLTLQGKDRYLLPLDEGLYTDGMQPTSIDSEFDFSTLSERALTEIMEIGANGELVLTIQIEFVDNNTLQNAYINFGNENDDEKADLNISRTLVCYFAYQD